MVLDLKVELRDLTNVLEHDEVFLTAGGRALDGVRDLGLQRLDLGLCLLLLGLGGLHARLELVRTLQQCGAVLRRRLPNLLAKRLLLTAQLVRRLDRGAALLVGGNQLVNQRRVLTAGGLGLAYNVRIFAQEFQINHKHSLYLVAAPPQPGMGRGVAHRA